VKEDVLEQIVDDYLQHMGYFTRHNIKFRPSGHRSDFNAKKDSVYSDIDVIGVNPLKRGHKRVYVVSCKSWQAGFSVRSMLEDVRHNRIRSGRESWKAFREIISPKWSEAFRQTIHQTTGYDQFTYIIAATRIKGDPREWEAYKPFLKTLKGNPMKLLSLSDMLDTIFENTKTTPASSEIGRLLQVIKASQWKTK
jgi:hypothetical protein